MHLGELAVVERGVEPAAREQLGVLALLDDAACVHDDDTVGDIGDQADVMRHKDY